MLMTSLLTGPGANIRNNTNLMTAQMNCLAEKAKNMSDVLTDAVEERYKRLHEHVNEVKQKATQRMERIQQSVQELKDKVEKKHAFLLNVARKINEFSEKCASTMNELNDKCQNVFKTCGKSKRSVRNFEVSETMPDSYNFTDHKELKDPTLIKHWNGLYTVHVKKNLTNETCQDAKKADDHVRKSAPADLDPQEPQYRLMSSVNGSDDFNNVSVSQGLHSEMQKEIIDSLTKESIKDYIEDNTPHHVYYHNKTRYIAHPHSETLHTGKIFHIRTRRSIFSFIICFFKQVFSILLRPLCDIIFNSIAYLCKIPKLVTHFITSIILKKFYYLEETVKKNAWIELDSNMTFEREVVEVRSSKQAALELEERLMKRFSFSPLMLLNFTDFLKVVSYILVYWRTYKYMATYASDTSFDNHYIDRYLIKYDRKAETSIFPLKKSDGEKYLHMSQLAMSPHEYFVATRGSLKAVAYVILVAAIEGGDFLLQTMLCLMYKYGPIRVEHYINVKDLNSIEAVSTNTSRIHLVFDTKSCFDEPVKPPSTTAVNFGLAGFILMISLTQIYFLRLRHTICDSFDPGIRKRRIEYLHSKISKGKDYRSKHAAETLFAKVCERNKMQRIFPWLFKDACAVCNREDLLEKCNQCDTVYCLLCLRDMEQRCKICEDLIFKKKSSLLIEQTKSSDNLE
ncbi:hypothetical protein ACHWQZ_G007447 [Mnemiopsis leidyi]